MNLGPSREAAALRGRSGAPVSLRRSWPLNWADLGLFVLAFVVISGVWIGLGFLVTGPLDGSVGDLDRRVADDLAANRTETWNTFSYWGSMLAETAVKIIVTALVVVVMLRRWRRWREPLLIATALILEASCFLAITLVVARHRPDVVALDSSPVDSSFPSGHTAAATVYGAFAVVVFLFTRKLWPRVLSVVLTLAVIVAVGLSRMYRGMHFLSDVTAGVLLGLVCLTVTWFIVERAHQRHLDHALQREFG